MSSLTFDVRGEPASQGSHTVYNGRIVQVNSAKHKKWRNAVTFAAMDLIGPDWEPLDEALEVSVIFYLTRGKTVQRETPTVSPDVDKLVRSIFDSLTDSKLIADDSRIIRLHAEKRYADHRGPGAVIRVNTLGEA
jgi:Holliday junction resolvase RusA-like endonuclease